ncbi:L,D-transpeptidase family protein [Nocardioides jensenii]|uniref:L,D-transpeptidase family protein n=1 Tax=Nocardioides jensenii TaxID=1843 RepID=UPI0009E7FF2D|nr:murein L,D-transpeptidase [Nocardioides jensenii]
MKQLLAVLALAIVTALAGPAPSHASSLSASGTVSADAPAQPAAALTATERAQRRLNALGCSAGPVDGQAGNWTRSAIIRFQSRHGFAQTGTLTTTTRTRLYADNARRCDVRPVPARSGTGRRIVISQKQNWVWLVGPAGRTIAQGGMIDNAGELARGSYGTGSYCGRAARIRLNRSGSVWLDNFIRFAACGFGFHQIPRSMSSGAQIHADWMLGTNMAASHGCIRLSRAMSFKVWDFTAAGRTPVRVV